MALDRKIRIGLQLSELLAAKDYEGEDIEKRLEAAAGVPAAVRHPGFGAVRPSPAAFAR